MPTGYPNVGAQVRCLLTYCQTRPNWLPLSVPRTMEIKLLRNSRSGYLTRVQELSRFLRAMNPAVANADPKFRNPAGVYRKLTNLLSVDDTKEAIGSPNGVTPIEKCFWSFLIVPLLWLSPLLRYGRNSVAGPSSLQPRRAERFGSRGCGALIPLFGVSWGSLIQVSGRTFLQNTTRAISS